MCGFKISSEKTVALPFTNGKGEVTLTVNGTHIKCVKETKFLGMVFDKRMECSCRLRRHQMQEAHKPNASTVRLGCNCKSARTSDNLQSIDPVNH